VPSCQLSSRLKSLRKARSAACSPSSVNTTDLALVIGLVMNPLSYKRFMASQLKLFQARSTS
jgi:hypothetical protein